MSKFKVPQFVCYSLVGCRRHVFTHDILNAITKVSHILNTRLIHPCVSTCYLQTVYNSVNRYSKSEILQHKSVNS